jgi:hypothetical protein
MKTFHCLFSLVVATACAAVAFAQQAQSPVSSADTSVTYGQGFTPPYYGGSGTGNWQFCVGGYTNWNPYPNGPAGTDIPGIGYSTSWTPPAAGSYGFYIAKCGDITYANSNFSGWWTLTVNKAPMATPSMDSSSYTIYVNQSWGGPGMSAPSSNGSGALLYCVSGITNFQSGSWTPTSAGAFQVFVAQKADSNHTGNVTDPIQGPMQVNYSCSTVNVLKQAQTNVSLSSSATTVQAGTTVNFTASGGSGSGGWVWSGASGSGTSASQYYSSAGTYTVTVYKQGDSTYNQSNTASTNITVKVVSFSWAFTPSNPSAYQTYNVSVGVDSGGFPAVTLYKNGGYFASGWFGTQGSTNDPSGTVNYQAYYSDTMYGFGGSDSRSLNIGLAAQAPVGISPTSQTINVGQSITFTASGGSGSGSFVWGGDAAGKSGSTASVTFNTAGSRTVSVYRNGDANYTASGTATAAITVIGYSAPVITRHPTSQTANAGATVSFTAAATGNPTPTYQWKKNGTAISGGTNATLTLTNVQSSDSGSYAMTATNSQGSATSNAATLTINSLPVFTAQPQNQSGTAGGSVSFAIAVSATPSPTEQWQRKPAGSQSWSSLLNGGAYSGVTTTTLTISGLTTAMSGDQFQCIATNSVGSTTSLAASLTVSTGTAADTTNQNQLNIHLPY